jgi:hypothetical protein
MTMDTKTPTERYLEGVQPLLISKSRYQAGLQCPKLLWYRLNQQDAFPPVDVATQAIFDQGTQVGTVAKCLFPKGIEIGAGVIKRSTVDELSRAALPERRPMFEAGFIAGSAFARADVLVPVDRGQWDLVEVKSSTKVKPEHISDIALQRHVYSEAGLRIRRCAVLHVNTDYVRRGEIDAQTADQDRRHQRSPRSRRQRGRRAGADGCHHQAEAVARCRYRTALRGPV